MAALTEQAGPAVGPSQTGGGLRLALWCAFLSLPLAGLGHVRARAVLLGNCFMVLEWVLTAIVRRLTWLPLRPGTLMIVLGLVLGTVCLHIFYAIDAFRRARRPSALVKPAWFKSAWFLFLVYFGLSFSISRTLPEFAWRSFSVDSGSMIPGLWTGEYIMMVLPQVGATVTYGDIVTFNPPAKPSAIYLKRVVALGGDTVQMYGGRLYLNRRLVPLEPRPDMTITDGGTKFHMRVFEEKISDTKKYNILKFSMNEVLDNTLEFRVPADCIFVMGDNRDNSLDSRVPKMMGDIPIANVIGINGFIYWSPDHSRIFTSLR
jgi:signal peptidase I